MVHKKNYEHRIHYEKLYEKVSKIPLVATIAPMLNKFSKQVFVVQALILRVDNRSSRGQPSALSATILWLAADATLVFQQLLTSAVLLDCNNSLRDAFQSIAQPNTALHDGILSLPQHL